MEDSGEYESPEVAQAKKNWDANANARKSLGRLSFKDDKKGRESQTGAIEDSGPKSTFVDAAAMKEKVRQKLSKPKYTVTDFYYETGCSQHIARSGIFDKATLSVIAFNAIWISIDTDMNGSALLLDAHPTFIIAENFFCLYFTFEWTVRFLSFRRKLDGLKDAWFVFDSFMVTMMVLETWIFTVLILLFMPSGDSGGAGNAGIMRLARLLRLSRMARMGKLLRVMPELMIMIKGMKAATRSVFFTLLLLVVIMYVYAIAFVQLAEESDIGAKFFPKVPESMLTLLLHGIFLDNVGFFVQHLGNNYVLGFLFFSFVLIGALTVMNMLVGVLCEVVSAVAATEQEEMLVNYVNERISRVMLLLDSDGGGSISKKEFLEILENVEAVRCLSDVGVDVFALIDLADYIFESDDAENTDEIELDFGRFMEVVLQLRGTNQATVKDIVDLRKFMRLSMQENFKQTSFILEKLSEGAKITETMMLKTMQSQSSLQSQSSFYGNGGGNGGDLCMLDLEQVGDWQDAQSQPPLRVQSFHQQPNYDVEGGVPPSMPPATPNGQLLSWIPIGITNLHSIAAQYSDELALTGQWTPMESVGSEMQPRIPEEAESDAIDATHQNGLTYPAKQGKCAGAMSEIRPQQAAFRIPKLQRTTNNGSVFEDSELVAIQRQFEWICAQLASSFNDAIDIAGRSVERSKWAGSNHANDAAGPPVEKSGASGGTYML